jgi:hypothetical protein
MSLHFYGRHFWKITARDAAVVGYVFLGEWSSIPALFYVARHLPRLLRKRKEIQRRARADASQVEKWFS